MKNKNVIKMLGKKKKFYYINCILSIVYGSCAPFSILATSYFVNSLSQISDNELFNMIVPAIILIVSYLLPIVDIFIDYNNNIINNQLDIEWNTYVSEMISKIPYSEYENQETYDKIKQISENNLYIKKITFAQLIISSVTNILLFAYILVKASIILLISLMIVTPFVGFFISKLAKNRYKANYEINLNRRKTYYKSSLLRDYTFAKEVRINNSASYMVKDWENNQKVLDKKNLNIKMKYGLLSKFISNFEYFIVLANLIIILVLFLNEYISIGLFIGLSTNIFSIKFLTKFSRIVDLNKNIKLLNSTCCSMKDIIKNDNQNPVSISKSIKKIEFKNVYFKYPKSTEYVLNDVSFSCSLHEKIAIVGENGAGKTTLIKLLLGLYEPTSGHILLDDIDISQYSNEDKAAIFGVSFQDYGKFSMSIRENIMMNDKMFNENDFEILKYLGIDIIAQNFEKGTETILGKNFGESVELSGGQWQNIAIARTLIGKKSVYIFDEPTAQMDPLREIEIFQKIITKTFDKISIFVTHRLGFTKNVDKILMIKNNSLCEVGSFDELIRIKGDFFRLYESQKNLYVQENVNDE